MMWYTGAIALALAGLIVRGGAAVQNGPSRWAEALGWIMRVGGGWLFVAAFGAWSPLWVAGALAVGVAALSALITERRWMRPGVDAAVVFVGAAVSVPSLGLPVALVAAGAFVAAGRGIDRWLLATGGEARRSEAVAAPAESALHRSGVLVRSLLVLLVLGAGVAATAWLAGRTAHNLRAWVANWTHFAVTPIRTGGRIELPTGAVAWVDRPAGEGPHPGALLFHGADPAGARQKAAEVIRRGLIDAGFVVLTVDHPGFGASPPPDPGAELEAWDPLPNARAAYRHLRTVIGNEPVIAVGHSMGCSQVLRLMGDRRDLRLAVLFGGSGSDPSSRDPYWYRRFHEDRGLEKKMPMAKWRRVWNRYYDSLIAAQALGPDHPPVCFVEFEFEHPNIVKTRDSLYRAIPGPKRRWRLALSNHYFCAQDLGAVNLIVGNTEIARRVGRRVRARLERFQP